MFGWLKRLFGIVEAEANAALDKMEDPVKMTEQGIIESDGRKIRILEREIVEELAEGLRKL